MNSGSERKRLVELLKLPSNCMPNAKCESCGLNGGCSVQRQADKILDDGWMRPPVKVGDVVYKPWKAGGRSVVAEFVVVAIISAIRDDWCIKYKKVGGTICYQAVISDIGKTVFTSREDAEKALNNVEKGNSCKGGESDA